MATLCGLTDNVFFSEVEMRMVQVNLRYVDTHCHLTSEEFEDDRVSLLARAQSVGIAMICSAIEPDDWQKCLRIASESPHVFASVGLDPTRYKDSGLALAWIRQHSSSLVALGEVGIDHYLVRDHSEREKQEQVFRQLIGLSRDLNLPLQVHSRSAGKRALDVLYECEAEQVHLHAFDGKASLARTASVDHGFYFSIPTSVVRSPQKRKLVKAVDIERMLIETDSPVLGPERNERNSPLNVPLALEESARILGREAEELREIVLQNTLRLYRRIDVL
jgi:TatD DNase family protein